MTQNLPSPAEDTDASPPASDIMYPSAIPFALVHLACLGAIWTGIGWRAAAIGVALYWLRIFAIGAGYHRYFSHCSLERLAYVNADIILSDEFPAAVARVQMALGRFLMVGQRWDLELDAPLDFSAPDWQRTLADRARRANALQPPTCIDYFAFTRGFAEGLPALAIGRTAWDNYLIWRAYSLGFSVVDATRVVNIVHQVHDYSHHPGGARAVWTGPEAQRNRELTGGWWHRYTIEDAAYILTPAGTAALPPASLDDGAAPVVAPAHGVHLALAGAAAVPRGMMRSGPQIRIVRHVAAPLHRSRHHGDHRMYPFIHLGPVTLGTYGLMVASGLLCAFFILRADLARRGLDADAESIIGITGLSGLAGARLYHLLESPSEFFADPWRAALQHHGLCLVRRGDRRVHRAGPAGAPLSHEDSADAGRGLAGRSRSVTASAASAA